MADPIQITLPLDLVNQALAALGECKAKDVYSIIQGIQNVAFPQLPPELQNPAPADATPAADDSAAPADAAPAADASAAPADAAPAADAPAAPAA